MNRIFGNQTHLHRIGLVITSLFSANERAEIDVNISGFAVPSQLNVAPTLAMPMKEFVHYAYADGEKQSS